MTSLLINMACAGLGFVYPAFLTFKVLKRRATRTPEENYSEMTKWLTYWCIMALFTVSETFMDFFASWIPFYSLLKIGFIAYLLKFNGAETVYGMLEPLLLQHEAVIDEKVDMLGDHAKVGAKWVATEGLNMAKRSSIQIAEQGQKLLAQALVSVSQMPKVTAPAAQWPASPFQSAPSTGTPFPSAPAADDFDKME